MTPQQPLLREPVLPPGPMEDSVGTHSKGHTAGRSHSHPVDTASAALPRDLMLTLRRHVDLLRTASAVCRPGLAG